jgi:hypothetical protein
MTAMANNLLILADISKILSETRTDLIKDNFAGDQDLSIC